MTTNKLLYRNKSNKLSKRERRNRRPFLKRWACRTSLIPDSEAAFLLMADFLSITPKGLLRPNHWQKILSDHYREVLVAQPVIKKGSSVDGSGRNWFTMWPWSSQLMVARTERKKQGLKMVGLLGFEPRIYRLWVGCIHRYATGPFSIFGKFIKFSGKSTIS